MSFLHRNHERFADRVAAGRRLATALSPYKDEEGLLVLGLPRGGVVVAAEVARELGAPLDALLVRKVSAPAMPEFAIGAVGEGVVVTHSDVIQGLKIKRETIAKAVSRAQTQLATLREELRLERPPLETRGRYVILVDDGIATGATVQAAARVLRRQGAKWIILAVPVIASATLPILSAEVNEIVALEKPEGFRSVGNYYSDFGATSTKEVREILNSFSTR